MKKLLFILAIALTTSCRKEWQCTSITTLNGVDYTTETTFTGSRDDMKDYEALGTFDKGWYSQTTTCKK